MTTARRFAKPGPDRLVRVRWTCLPDEQRARAYGLFVCLRRTGRASWGPIWGPMFAAALTSFASTLRCLAGMIRSAPSWVLSNRVTVADVGPNLQAPPGLAGAPSLRSGSGSVRRLRLVRAWTTPTYRGSSFTFDRSVCAPQTHSLPSITGTMDRRAGTSSRSQWPTHRGRFVAS